MYIVAEKACVSVVTIPELNNKIFIYDQNEFNQEMEKGYQFVPLDCTGKPLHYMDPTSLLSRYRAQKQSTTYIRLYYQTSL